MQSCVLHLSWNIWILPTVKKTPMSTSRQPLFTENPLSHNRLQNLCFPLLWTYFEIAADIRFHALCISVVRVATLFVLFLWLCVVGTTGLYSVLFIFFLCASRCPNWVVPSRGAISPGADMHLCINLNPHLHLQHHNEQHQRRDMINPLPQPQSFLTLEMFVSTFTNSNLNFHHKLNQHRTSSTISNIKQTFSFLYFLFLIF